MQNSNGYFRTPDKPEGFTTKFSGSDLRVIDYSALEYDTMYRAVIEYIKTYHRDKFNDFVASNGFIMLTELVCYIGSVLSNRLDILANESFLPTCFTREAVVNHLNLIGQHLKRQTPATVSIMCTIDSPVSSDIRIKTNGVTVLQAVGADGTPIYYEIFSAPYDWSSDIIIPAKKYGVVAWGIEGTFAPAINVVSSGGFNQQVALNNNNILDEPIMVTVDNIPWTRVNFLDNYGPNDLVYAVQFGAERAHVLFGDNKFGKTPLSGQNINVRYRIGGGARGRVSAGAITQSRAIRPEPPSSATVAIRFRNEIPSEGGYDVESINEAKERAPKTWATHNFVATSTDYATTAMFFRHSVYGAILKAAATIHTSINANVVRVATLAEGIDGPVLSSVGLKSALKTYLSELNVLTDDIDMVDAKIRPINIDISVIVFNNVDASIVKSQVDDTVDEYFDVKNWDLGQPLYVSDLYEILTNINGVKYINIFSPGDDIYTADNLKPVKITDPDRYDEIKACVESYPSDNVVVVDEGDFTFSLTLPVGIRVADVISYVWDECDIVISCHDCVEIDEPDDESINIYEFRSYDQDASNIVFWNELITLGDKNIRIYYER